jgi:hypothetical protein
MYADTGRWAFYATGTGAVAYASSTMATTLTSDSDCSLTETDLATCDDQEPTSTTGWTFTNKGDSLTRQLITNGPAYATTGPRAWKGPYTDAIPETDPWGQSYLVNIGGAATTVAVVAISAGPDGILQTQGSVAATSNLTVQGDDIIARVK